MTAGLKKATEYDLEKLPSPKLKLDVYAHLPSLNMPRTIYFFFFIKMIEISAK